MPLIERRSVLVGVAGTLFAQFFSTISSAQEAALTLLTAGPGSAYLPYGQGLVRAIVANGGPAVVVRESKGSNDNLAAVNADPNVLGTAFLGSAFDVIQGTGFANGRTHDNVRALFPMYETAFMAAALRTSRIADIASLNGKKVGCGPGCRARRGILSRSSRHRGDYTSYR